MLIVPKTKMNFLCWSWFKVFSQSSAKSPFDKWRSIPSVNSENEESDRDLVQNSLGGFLYGGQLSGAIAGFGTWVFNPLFDKTPSEMVLDSTGISNIWKDEKSQFK